MDPLSGPTRRFRVGWDGHSAGEHARDEERRVLLVCSPGGHLQQMLALEPAWRGCECTWVTLHAADTDELLADRDALYGHGPTNRSIKNLFRNLAFAWRIVRDTRPDAILSTGAGLAVPFFLVGKLRRRRLVYVESLTRSSSLSLSGRLVYPIADTFLVQWPEAATKRRMAYHGSVL
jgi:beta-1,4-N-acetylglucosaminyltransferase